MVGLGCDYSVGSPAVSEDWDGDIDDIEDDIIEADTNINPWHTSSHILAKRDVDVQPEGREEYAGKVAVRRRQRKMKSSANQGQGSAYSGLRPANQRSGSAHQDLAPFNEVSEFDNQGAGLGKLGGLVKRRRKLRRVKKVRAKQAEDAKWAGLVDHDKHSPLSRQEDLDFGGVANRTVSTEVGGRRDGRCKP